MSNFEEQSAPLPARPPYRPPIGIPIRQGKERRYGAMVSLLLHIAVILFIVGLPALSRTIPIFAAPAVGAGGDDSPAGGGGGGTRGTGGRPPMQERLQFMQVAPPPVAPVAPVIEPKPEEVKPPEIVPPPPEPVPEPPVVPVATVTPDPASTTTVGTIDLSAIGRGGGTGNDGTTGSGPGSGGGVGSGVGTGRGSGTGPGTGGGPGTIYPPTTTMVLLPPPDVPARIRPYTIVALFDVDSTGKVLDFTFNESRDSGYNRKVKAMLAEIRFRPGTDWTGRPVRATAKLEFVAY